LGYQARAGQTVTVHVSGAALAIEFAAAHISRLITHRAQFRQALGLDSWTAQLH
jgi:hypothetical protein